MNKLFRWLDRSPDWFWWATFAFICLTPTIDYL